MASQNNSGFDPTEIGRLIGQRLEQRALTGELEGDDGTTVNCKKSVNVLPLRYSAVYAEDDDQAALDKVPECQGQPVADIPLSQAKYTARFLREGYLYVLLNRLGTYRWEHSFYVSADALLSPIDPNHPTKGSGGIPYFSIRDVEDVSDGYLLFLPDPLSVRMLERLKAEPYLREPLQQFPIAELAHSCRGQDVISPPLLSQQVAEFVGHDDESVGQLLQKQLFPALSDPLDEHIQPTNLADQWSRFEDIQQALDDRKGFAVVLSDAIGITQELNNYRNDALEPLKEWMEKADDKGLTNEQRFYTAELIRDLKKGYVDARINSLAQRDVQRYRLRVGNRYMPSVRAVEEAEIGGNSHPMRRDFQLAREYADNQASVLKASSERIAAERKREFQQEYDDKYAPLLDQNARERFEQDMAEESQQQETLMAPRAPDHLAWLRSEALHDALNWYDPHEIIWGWAYSIQVMQATIGMEATEQGASQLAEWWRNMDMQDTQNLAWGVYCLNQHSIRQAGQNDIRDFHRFEARFAQGDDDSWIGPEPARIMDGFKQLTVAFNTANSALVAESPEWFKSSALGITMAWYTQFMYGFFEKTRSEAMDRTTLRISLGLVQAQLAYHASQMGVKRVWFSKGSERELAKARRFLARDMAAALDGTGSQFMQFRLGVVVAIIESYALYQALSKSDKGARDYAKIAGSLVVLAAAIVETVSASLNMLLVVGKYHATDVGTAARMRLGGFAFWGGMLASAGALFSAVDDLTEAVEQASKDKPVLVVAYTLRFLANVGIAILGTALALASSAAYLARIASSGKNALARRLASLLAPLARTLAATAIRGALVIGYSIVSWAAIVLSVGLWFFSDDDLQAWCKRCTFSKEDQPDYFDDYAEETGAFYHALQDVT